MPADNPEFPTPDPAMEAALSRLRPAGIALTRDSLMFRAGQAAARRPTRVWQAASATLGAALTLSLFLRPAAPPAREVYVQTVQHPTAPVPSQPESDKPRPAADRPTGLAYLSLRDKVLANGVDAIPSPVIEVVHTTEPLPGPGGSFKLRSPADGKNSPNAIQRRPGPGV